MRHDARRAAHLYLAGKIKALEKAGADVILCVSNTMHRVAEPIMAERGTAFIHIADPRGEAIQHARLRRVGLLGTLVMRSEDLRRRYRERFGVDILVPDDSDKEVIDRVMFDELVRRDLRPAPKREYIGVIDRMRAAGAEGVIPGCTEIFFR